MFLTNFDSKRFYQTNGNWVANASRNHCWIKNVFLSLAGTQCVNAVGDGVVLFGRQEVALALGDVDHVRGDEVGRLALNVNSHATLSEQSDVIEVVGVPFVLVAHFDKMHLAQPEIAYADHFGFRKAHSCVNPILVGSDCKTPNLIRALATRCSNCSCANISAFFAASICSFVSNGT